MNSRKRVRLLAVVALIAALSTTACGGPNHAVATTDDDVPGELIVTRDMDDDQQSVLFVVAADGSESRQISDAEGFHDLVLSPDGRTIAAVQARQNDQQIVLVDVETGVLNPIAVPTGSYSSISMSAAAGMIAFSGVDYARFTGASRGVVGDQIFVANLDGSKARLLVNDMPDRAAHPIWSFDGTRIAFVRASGIIVSNLDGTDQHQITKGMTPIFSPAWSPIDDRIAFMGHENGYSAVYLVNADGSDQSKLSPEGFLAGNPVWSPDGSWIAFTSAGPGGSKLHLIRPDRSDHRAIDIDKDISGLSWSPDGSWIAFTTTYMESDGPITAIHLSVIDPFDDDPDVHTLLRDLSDFTAPAWRDRPATGP